MQIPRAPQGRERAKPGTERRGQVEVTEGEGERGIYREERKEWKDGQMTRDLVWEEEKEEEERRQEVRRGKREGRSERVCFWGREE